MFTSYWYQTRSRKTAVYNGFQRRYDLINIFSFAHKTSNKFKLYIKIHDYPIVKPMMDIDTKTNVCHLYIYLALYEYQLLITGICCRGVVWASVTIAAAWSNNQGNWALFQFPNKKLLELIENFKTYCKFEIARNRL